MFIPQMRRLSICFEIDLGVYAADNMIDWLIVTVCQPV